MKTLIVFSGIFMMAFTCVIYQGDMNIYMHEQETLKIISEEAACQAALCFDEEAYGEGKKEFDIEACQETVREYIEDSRKLLVSGDEYVMSFVMEFEDDVHGYSASNPMRLPSVSVTVKAETDDFFRLPFLETDEITRKSKYEIKGL